MGVALGCIAEIRSEECTKLLARSRQQRLDRFGRPSGLGRDLGDRKPVRILVEQHLSAIVLKAEERGANHAGAFGAFEGLQRRRGFSGSVGLCAEPSQAIAAPPKDTMPGDAQEPVAKLASRGLEVIDLLDREQPNLLVDVLGYRAIAADEVIEQRVDIPGMTVVHRRPRRFVAARERPILAGFLVHQPAASASGFP
jgi:hypothetical protein